MRTLSRERELATDRVGAQAGGARAIGLSLLRIGVLQPHVDAVLGEAVAAGAGGAAANAPQSGLLRKIIARVRDQGLGDPRAHLEDQQPHPTDTHPTTWQHLEALADPFRAKASVNAKTTQIPRKPAPTSEIPKLIHNPT